MKYTGIEIVVSAIGLNGWNDIGSRSWWTEQSSDGFPVTHVALGPWSEGDVIDFWHKYSCDSTASDNK